MDRLETPQLSVRLVESPPEQLQWRDHLGPDGVTASRRQSPIQHTRRPEDHRTGAD